MQVCSSPCAFILRARGFNTATHLTNKTRSTRNKKNGVYSENFNRVFLRTSHTRAKMFMGYGAYRKQVVLFTRIN